MSDPWRKRFLLLVGGLFLFRLLYAASGLNEIAADEAYYWVWSKHPDWSYFSKGPLVAYLIGLSTALGGDTTFFVRLPAVLGGTLTLVFAGRLARALFSSWRAAFWTVVLLASVPILVVGALMMTIDNPVLGCWTVAAFYAWRATSPESRRYDWWLVGLALGLGLMAKAVMIFFIPSLLLFLTVHRPSRPQLKTPGPWTALALGFALNVPQLLWNARHDWVMVRDFADKGDTDEPFRLSLEFVLELIVSQLAVFSPLIFIGVVAVLVHAVRRARRGDAPARFVLCFSLPVFGFYWGLALHAHIYANWMLVGYLTPLVALAGYVNERWDVRPASRGRLRFAAAAALLLGALPVYLMLFSQPLYRLTGSETLARLDLSSKIWGFRDLAARVDHWREELDRGRPIFVFDKEYLNPSVLNFYCEGDLPAISLQTDTHRNQYYFIADLDSRKGHDAIAVLEDPDDSYIRRMEKAFWSVEFLEAYPIVRGGVELRRFHLYHCQYFRRWKY